MSICNFTLDQLKTYVLAYREIDEGRSNVPKDGILRYNGRRLVVKNMSPWLLKHIYDRIMDVMTSYSTEHRKANEEKERLKGLYVYTAAMNLQ
jgi:hypothetical protein